MIIEHVISIKAPAATVWQVLIAELANADPSRSRIELEEPGQLLVVAYELQPGLRLRFTYELMGRGDGAELVGRAEAQGWRAQVFNLVTLGRSWQDLDRSLMQGMANLKQAAEAAPA